MASVNKIHPLENRVVITSTKENKTASGIVIPDTASKERPIEGAVVAVGPGKRTDDGKVVECRVKVGDKVLFGKYSGTEVKLDDQDYIIMREEDIFAIID